MIFIVCTCRGTYALAMFAQWGPFRFLTKNMSIEPPVGTPPPAIRSKTQSLDIRSQVWDVVVPKTQKLVNCDFP